MPARKRVLRSIDEIDTYAHETTTGYLECRSDGHRWEPLDASIDRKVRVYERWRRCQRCKAERYEMVSFSGEVLRRSVSYKHADGYLRPKGSGHITGSERAVIRAEMFGRILGGPAK